MKTYLNVSFALSAIAPSAQATAQITLYEHDGFRGRAFTTGREVSNFERSGFNDRASSVIVEHGRWEVCDDARFHGHCVVLREGNYGSLSGMGLNDSGRDIATVGGAAVGAAVGANVGRDRSSSERDVQGAPVCASGQ